MCIAAPAKVVEINREKESLFADFGGVRQEALLEVLEEEDREMEKARMADLNQ